MNNPATAAPAVPPRRTIDIVNASLKRRYAQERRFQRVGAVAVALGLAFVVLLFADIIGKGYTAFAQTYIRLPVTLSAEAIDPSGTREPQTLAAADYMAPIRAALRQNFPERDRAPRSAPAQHAGQRRRPRPAARAGDGRSQPDRHHPGTLGAGRDRYRHADEGLHRPRRRRGRAAGEGPGARLGRAAGGAGADRKALQHHLLHPRHLARARAGRHRRGA